MTHLGSKGTNPPMKTNDAGIQLLKTAEGLRLQAYPDPGTGSEPWTIGYGHTGTDVEKGTTWTQAQADQALAHDLFRFEQGVTAMLQRLVSSNQFSALVVFAYNLGLGNLRSSTLLKCVNAGNFEDASREFGKWTKASGKILPGLVARREAESRLFLSP